MEIISNKDNCWVATGFICINCNSFVKVCDSISDTSDYEWFCVNECCYNNIGEKLYDDQEPLWARKLD